MSIVFVVTIVMVLVHEVTHAVVTQALGGHCPWSFKTVILSVTYPVLVLICSVFRAICPAWALCAAVSVLAGVWEKAVVPANGRAIAAPTVKIR